MKIKGFLRHYLVIIILLVAAILRLWNLGNIPPHLTPDEASLGYNVYSILKTGRDEFGKFLPIIFKSFGDFKPGLYIYLTVPSVAIFGLTEFAVRLPSAIAGVLSVWLIYLIAGKLFNEENDGKWRVSHVAAFVAATNPWLIYFSRGAWEANVSLTLALGGIYFFLKSLKNSWLIVISVATFALTLLTYQGAKLSSGIILLLLIVFWFRQLVKFDKKILALSILTGFLISLPIFLSVLQGHAGRLEVFSVFSYPRPKEYLENFLIQGNEKVGDLTYYLFHSETLNYLRGIMGRWFNHFSGRFLFFEGDWSNPRHSAPYQGVLLITDLLTLLCGLAVYLREKMSKEKLFILFWLGLAPLPAILSRDQVHAVRALNMSIPLIIVISLGLNSLINWIKRRKFSVPYYLILTTYYFLGLIYFLDGYFVHVPKHNSNLWEYGYKQIVEEVAPIQKNYKIIKVQRSFAQPYIYFLFYEKYDPAKYQASNNWVPSESVNDVGYITKLDNIEFAPIDWSINRGEKGTLFIADPVRIPPEDSNDPAQFKVIKEIKYLNGRDTAFRIIEVK